jgi:hypothetical protein
MNFLHYFLFGGPILACLDPDPDYQFGSADPIESGSNPDPEHCKLAQAFYQHGTRRFTHSDRNIAVNGSQHFRYK